MRGSVKAVPADAVVPFAPRRQGVAGGGLGHRLVEGGVEHADLRHARQSFPNGPDVRQRRRIVQRGEGHEPFDLSNRRLV